MSLATDAYKAKVLLGGSMIIGRDGESPLEEYIKVRMEMVSKILRY